MPAIATPDTQCSTTTSGLRESATDFLQEVIVNKLPDYELRHSQIKMIEACSQAIETGGTLLAEASTGCGKSFSYLIPVILSGKKAHVSTRTKNLQEQLMSKDLAFLSSLYDFDYAIAKGRGNYLCLRRLRSFGPTAPEEIEAYEAISVWEAGSVTGDFEECPVKGLPVRDKLCSDGDVCVGQKCSYHKECYYFKARKKWETAQIIVANHALLTTNAMLPEESKLLPAADVLIVDEGHALDDVMSDQIGVSLSKYNCDRILNQMLKVDDKGVYKGILSKARDLFGQVEGLREDIKTFWARVEQAFQGRLILRKSARLDEALRTIAASLKSLIEAMKVSVLGLFKEDEETELKGIIMKLHALASEMETFSYAEDGYVRWVDVSERTTELRMAPIYPRDFVQSNIVPEYGTIILTSATLSVSGDFKLIQNILGLDVAATISLPSPFDLRSQVTMTVSKGIDFKKDNGVVNLSKVILDEATKQDGGILVLFTSRDIMRKTWDMVSDDLLGLDRNPMQQGDMPNRAMLESMRESTNGVIFGLESFWEGVDVKGDSLKSLIITKLPFEVPSEPMVIARTEAIQKAGGNPFSEYSLPKACLKFKQGFGRLIRSASDTGRVIVCDERIQTAKYGRKFLDSVL